MRITRFLLLGALFICTGCVAYGPGVDAYAYNSGYGYGYRYRPAPLYIAPAPVYVPPVYVRPAPRVIVPIFVAPPVGRVPYYRPHRHYPYRHGRPH
jgi:hypothetical protein